MTFVSATNRASLPSTVHVFTSMMPNNGANVLLSTRTVTGSLGGWVGGGDVGGQR